jgi:hypothetical protein
VHSYSLLLASGATKHIMLLGRTTATVKTKRVQRLPQLSNGLRTSLVLAGQGTLKPDKSFCPIRTIPVASIRRQNLHVWSELTIC